MPCTRGLPLAAQRSQPSPPPVSSPATHASGHHRCAPKRTASPAAYWLLAARLGTGPMLPGDVLLAACMWQRPAPRAPSCCAPDPNQTTCQQQLSPDEPSTTQLLSRQPLISGGQQSLAPIRLCGALRTQLTHAYTTTCESDSSHRCHCRPQGPPAVHRTHAVLPRHWSSLAVTNPPLVTKLPFWSLSAHACFFLVVRQSPPVNHVLRVIHALLVNCPCIVIHSPHP